MSSLCQGRICHTRRCTLSHGRPQDISSTALDNFFLILSLLFSSLSFPFLVCFFVYMPTYPNSVVKMKRKQEEGRKKERKRNKRCSSSRLSVYLAVDLFVHLHLSTHLSRYVLCSLFLSLSFLFSLRRPSFFAPHFSLYVTSLPLSQARSYSPASVSIFLSISRRPPSSFSFPPPSQTVPGIHLKNLRRDKSLFAPRREPAKELHLRLKMIPRASSRVVVCRRSCFAGINHFRCSSPWDCFARARSPLDSHLSEVDNIAAGISRRLNGYRFSQTEIWCC